MVHRNTYRGKNLGTSFTETQKQAISSGTFDDIYVGDYWVDGTNKYRVADINYWFHLGLEPKTPHIIVIPDNSLYTEAMSTANASGYGNSTLHKSNYTKAKTFLSNVFGDDNFVTNAEMAFANSTNPNSSAVSTIVNGIESMTIAQVFGNACVTSVQGGTDVNQWITVDLPQGARYVQFSLFQLNPSKISADIQKGYWLGQIGPNNAARGYNIGGNSSFGSVPITDSAVGVRPFAIIKG